MRLALELAELGRLRVEPNPPVGAIVLSAAGDVVGRGHHVAYGEAHAEPVALADASEEARGGTLVVTLEPCAHTAKKTPPCLPEVLASGVQRVVIGSSDPNPATRGLAAPELEAAGIEVVTGVLREECDALIARYAAFAGCGVPWTIAKWAMSADGRIADARGAARWVSGPESRRLVHSIRAHVDAIVVGRGTVARDDPELTPRDVARPPGRNPALRVVLDSHLRVPTTVRVITTAREVPTVVFCTPEAHAARTGIIEDQGAEVVPVAADETDRVDLDAAFRVLHERGVRRVLLESGGTLTASMLRAGLVHQVMTFVAPVVVGGERAPTPFGAAGWEMTDAPRLEESRVTAVGNDALLEGYWPADTAEFLPPQRRTRRGD